MHWSHLTQMEEKNENEQLSEKVDEMERFKNNKEENDFWKD